MIYSDYSYMQNRLEHYICPLLIAYADTRYDFIKGARFASGRYQDIVKFRHYVTAQLADFSRENPYMSIYTSKASYVFAYRKGEVFMDMPISKAFVYPDMFRQVIIREYERYLPLDKL